MKGRKKPKRRGKNTHIALPFFLWQSCIVQRISLPLNILLNLLQMLSILFTFFTWYLPMKTNIKKGWWWLERACASWSDVSNICVVQSVEILHIPLQEKAALFAGLPFSDYLCSSHEIWHNRYTLGPSMKLCHLAEFLRIGWPQLCCLP